MKWVAGGVWMAAAIVAGAYAVAATTGATGATAHVTPDSAWRDRVATLEAAWGRASARYRAAHGKCESPERNKRHLCNVEAWADAKRSGAGDTRPKEAGP
jgi:hypothetical protein